MFHYTSNEGAIGIIESNSIYATHYKHLNDIRELHIAREIVEPALENSLRKLTERLIIDNGGTSSDLSAMYPADSYRQQVEKILDKVSGFGERMAPVFVSSFCDHKSSSNEHKHGLLSQWRAYGSSGGCALEFDEFGLKSLIDAEQNRFAHFNAGLHEVLYNNYHEIISETELNYLADELMSVDMLNDDDTKRAQGH